MPPGPLGHSTGSQTDASARYVTGKLVPPLYLGREPITRSTFLHQTSGSSGFPGAPLGARDSPPHANPRLPETWVSDLTLKHESSRAGLCTGHILCLHQPSGIWRALEMPGMERTPRPRPWQSRLKHDRELEVRWFTGVAHPAGPHLFEQPHARRVQTTPSPAWICPAIKPSSVRMLLCSRCPKPGSEKPEGGVSLGVRKGWAGLRSTAPGGSLTEGCGGTTDCVRGQTMEQERPHGDGYVGHHGPSARAEERANELCLPGRRSHSP
ncbi:uncharacterized protein LOC121019553 [Herpailurus yagouaroundi]|uniref:uncharacterized protein LOC121019553 n=1 Tax=Herpailurus yagouaroundi TaxID=1608482 RepID=UPI001AD68738|nr:uncharacterized protein LOC121019553 [Puma yagouaroundi]XP_040315002.1 uncharacterized protein LOC121019553 [Puma yagouaroundi]XP_040315004.1 uncharacterized protein LOC121019553 [Puma yagouaroundi]